MVTKIESQNLKINIKQAWGFEESTRHVSDFCRLPILMEIQLDLAVR